MNCLRPLEIGEHCACTQPPLPRDGFRANCEHFKARAGYRGKAYIACTRGKLRFDSSEERNEYYKTYCCGCGEGCEKHDGR